MSAELNFGNVKDSEEEKAITSSGIVYEVFYGDSLSRQ